jgi:hypothetical protein
MLNLGISPLKISNHGEYLDVLRWKRIPLEYFRHAANSLHHILGSKRVDETVQISNVDAKRPRIDAPAPELSTQYLTCLKEARVRTFGVCSFQRFLCGYDIYVSQLGG